MELSDITLSDLQCIEKFLAFQLFATYAIHFNMVLQQNVINFNYCLCGQFFVRPPFPIRWLCSEKNALQCNTSLTTWLATFLFVGCDCKTTTMVITHTHKILSFSWLRRLYHKSRVTIFFMCRVPSKQASSFPAKMSVWANLKMKMFCSNHFCLS